MVDHVLLEDAQVAVSEHIQLQALELQAQLVGHVADGDGAMIGQAGARTNGSELRHGNLNLIVV